MAKAVGLGGVFFKAHDPKALAAWYAEQLGVRMADEGSIVFEGPDSAGMTVFAPFSTDTKYFGDGPQQWMVNFRVDDLDALLAKLESAGVRVDMKREEYPFGRFGWIWDPEGNRIELWEPAPKAEKDVPEV